MFLVFSGFFPLPGIRVYYLIVIFVPSLSSFKVTDNFYWPSQQNNFIPNNILRTLFSDIRRFQS